jgi:hypothetical protein
MSSIYDVIAESCARLAARTGRTSDKVRLLQLADQWRTVPADGQGPGKKPLASPSRAGNCVDPVRLVALTPESPRERQKLAGEINSDPAVVGHMSQLMGRSRGGLTSKIHAVVDANGLPVRLGLTSGEAHDNRLAGKLLPRTQLG